MNNKVKEFNFQQIKALIPLENSSEQELLFAAKQDLDNPVLMYLINWAELVRNKDFKFELRKLMDTYSLVEIAYVADFIAIPEEEKGFINNVKTVMDKGVVKNYCFGEYESILPLNLAQRFEENNENLKEQTISTINVAPFYEFLNSYQYLHHNNNLCALLFSDILRNNEESLLQPINWINYLEESLNDKLTNIFDGILRYVEYTHIIYNLFKNCEDIGALESAILSYHSKSFNRDNDYIIEIQAMIPKIAENCKRFVIEQSISADLTFFSTNEADDVQKKISYIQERIAINIEMSLYVY